MKPFVYWATLVICISLIGVNLWVRDTYEKGIQEISKSKAQYRELLVNLRKEFPQQSEPYFGNAINMDTIRKAMEERNNTVKNQILKHRGRKPRKMETKDLPFIRLDTGTISEPYFNSFNHPDSAGYKWISQIDIHTGKVTGKYMSKPQIDSTIKVLLHQLDSLEKAHLFRES